MCFSGVKIYLTQHVLINILNSFYFISMTKKVTPKEKLNYEFLIE